MSSSVIRASLPCPGKEPHRNPTNGLTLFKARI
ncbi:hypothetical protein SNOG_13889 [Parastagonospora nodorum SN15]|uniref:Uncharacterized protein n=1 Tax=Phaeosphaeria nodorum (strain SN15 / ATCC MYA-4574 / FGSC 10173) TaxID=321614 RepID=Q0U2X5_PHANO|nr:hypothetical protein SNOG_13889 [Parastagonospora nodorum SN15]EAT78913.1 hypothetical protein SNOG_13889 [Parastagonospora nodorum SN15]